MFELLGSFRSNLASRKYLPAKFHSAGAHFFLFKLAITPGHLGLHLIDVESLTHAKALTACDGTGAELAPFSHGTLGYEPMDSTSFLADEKYK